MNILSLLQRLKTPSGIALTLFHFVFLFIILMNFPWGKFMIGWDSITPEFNFGLNFQRALFASWQENYGTGTLTGHGFAATLPHTLITYIFSFFMPLEAIRPAFTFLMLYLGGLGMYVLVGMIIRQISEKTASVPDNKNIAVFIPFIALLSGFFYMLNLGTIQIFYVQLEAFIAQFASLPWLFTLILLLLKKMTYKRALLFCVISFFASIQGFIPSLFISYTIGVSLLLLSFVLFQREKRRALKKVLTVISLIFLTNLYWLSSLFIYTKTQNGAFLSAYNNILSTPHFIDVNKKYGTLQDVMLLKGYLFDSYQLGDHILRPFIDHLSLLLPQIIGYIFFVILCYGLLFTLRRQRSWVTTGLASLLLFFFATLATNVPPLSYLTSVLQFISPTFEQAFRTAFTKFSIGTSFAYSIFFGIGLFGILQLASVRFTRKEIKSLLAGIAVLLLIYALPVFKGDLFYSKLKITIPQSYTATIDYFATQTDGRIADFPQECADGWYAYKWGYFGSGFYWYAIKQPMLSRTFDVWSKNNENYYWEITQAIQQEDFKKATTVLEKYKVRWILYDPNAYYCNNQRGVLIHQKFISYLKKSSEYTLTKRIASKGIAPILIFESTDSSRKNYTTLKTDTRNIGPTEERLDEDYAYNFENTYMSSSTSPYESYYPFRSLLTKRGSMTDTSLTNVQQEKDHITLTSTLPQGLQGYIIAMRPFKETEKIVPVFIEIKQSGTTNEVIARLQTPQIVLDGKNLWNHSATISLGEYSTPASGEATIKVNGQTLQKNKNNNLYEGVLFTDIDNSIDIVSGTSVLLNWDSSSDPAFHTLIAQGESITIPPYTKGTLSVRTPQIKSDGSLGVSLTDSLSSLLPVACNEITQSKRNLFEIKNAPNAYIRLLSQNSSQCINVSFTKLFSSVGYLASIQSENETGNNAKLLVYQNSRTIYGPVFLNQNSKQRSNIIIPPTSAHGLGYDIQLINSSESQKKTINTLHGITLSYIPYNFLKSLRLATPSHSYPEIHSEKSIKSDHPDETTYSFSLSTPQNAISQDVLILSQSFHTGWKAYSLDGDTTKSISSVKRLFPFFFGKELKNHVLINNWENGWIIDDTPQEKHTIILLFLPQYLVYLGYIFLLGTFIFLTIKTFHSKKND
ncbi:MAG: hypothetical protein RLZZ455_974 [Candidatus Parcubacteria bacterium]